MSKEDIIYEINDNIMDIERELEEIDNCYDRLEMQGISHCIKMKIKTIRELVEKLDDNN